MSSPVSRGRITDAALSAMQADIGLSYARHGWNEQVTKQGIEHYAVGVGDLNPLWIDNEYAAGTVWNKLIAPPCYLYSHINGSLLETQHGALTVDRWLPGVLGLWTDEKWLWARPVVVGETIHARTSLHSADLVESSDFGAGFVVQVERTEFFSASSGETVAENFMTIRRFERAGVEKKSKYANRALASYSPEETAAIAKQYSAERSRGAEARTISSANVGDKMGTMLKGPLTVTNIIAYLAGAGTSIIFSNRQHHQFLSANPTAALVHPETGLLENVEAPHWDSELARAYSGLPAGYDLGAQRVSWFSHFLTDWMGDSGFLKELRVRLRKPNLLGDLTTITGKIASVDVEAKEVTLEMEATNQLQETTATAIAVVDLSRWG